MDQVGPIIAAELARVKAELERKRVHLYEARKSRDRWRTEAIMLRRQQSRTARFSAAYRERQKAA